MKQPLPTTLAFFPPLISHHRVRPVILISWESSPKLVFLCQSGACYQATRWPNYHVDPSSGTVPKNAIWEYLSFHPYELWWFAGWRWIYCIFQQIQINIGATTRITSHKEQKYLWDIQNVHNNFVRLLWRLFRSFI